jgi:hypothetical protein
MLSREAPASGSEPVESAPKTAMLRSVESAL